MNDDKGSQSGARLKGDRRKGWLNGIKDGGEKKKGAAISTASATPFCHFVISPSFRLLICHY
jgi:hypothetical protein